jgi:hypothetical protein
MRAELLRRLKVLEQRSATSEAEQLPGLPLWYLRALEAHLGFPVDEYGRPKFVAVKRGSSRAARVAADSSPAGTEESPVST